MKPKLAVVPDPNEEVATEVLATEIIAMSEGIKRLRAGRLNDRALVMLIVAASPPLPRYKHISQAQVRAVLQGIESLSAKYVRATSASQETKT